MNWDKACVWYPEPYDTGEFYLVRPFQGGYSVTFFGEDSEPQDLGAYEHGHQARTVAEAHWMQLVEESQPV